MARHMARVTITGEALVRELGMPEGTNIYNIIPHDSLPDVFVITVEHADLPAVPEGGLPIGITPTVTRYGERLTTWNWNLPNGRNEG